MQSFFNKEHELISVPKVCDICGYKLRNEFIDGKLKGSSWCYMCVACHAVHGIGYGLGKAQYYRYNDDENRWVNETYKIA